MEANKEDGESQESISEVPMAVDNYQPASFLGKRDRSEENYNEAAFQNNWINEQEGQDEDDDAHYDPMSFANIQKEEDESVKRFKIDEDSEANFVSPSQFLNQNPPMELDSLNSVKLRKGNLVIRRSITKKHVRFWLLLILNICWIFSVKMFQTF